MNVPTITLCWICRARPANTAEHRFKASDFRLIAPTASQRKPVFLQRNNEATNIRVGSARAELLTFSKPICADCNNSRTQPYDRAWEQLSSHLQSQWETIARQGRFDLTKPFRGKTRDAALRVHLYFVKSFGCKLNEDNVQIDLAPFSRALITYTPHPEVTIFVCNGDISKNRMLMYDSEIHVNQLPGGDIHSATWIYMVHPIAIKVAYIKTGAKLRVRGAPWHPGNPSKIVKLSPLL